MMKTLSVLLFIFLGQIHTAYSASSLFDYLNFLNQNEQSYQTSLSSEQSSEILKNVDSIFEAATSEGSEYNGYTPQFLVEDFNDVAFELYNEGFAKLSLYENFKKQYQKLSNIQVPATADPKVFWKQQYNTLFKNYLNSITQSPEVCARSGENATVRKCCRGLLKLSLHKSSQLASSNLGNKGSGEVCNVQSDCRSGLCTKEALDKPGVCSSVKSCYELQSLGKDCSGNKPYCGKGRCVQINKANLGIGECRAEATTCSKDIECCSNKCSKNKCVKSSICSDCVGRGEKPAQGQSCCPGNYLAPSGKCRVIFRPLVPRTTKVEQKIRPVSILEVLISNIFISSVHAQTSSAVACSGDNALTSAQKTLVESKVQTCRAENSSGGAALTDCLRSVDDLQASLCRDSAATLTAEQQTEFDARRATCIENNTAGSVALNDCLKTIDAAENLVKEEGSSASDTNRYEEFQRQYNIPTVTAKTYSDARKCEFRAFNDNWKASSNTERNAEIFLRAFEFTFAGSGTQDYWEQQGKGNIFKRANKAALALRENRGRMVTRAAAIDKEITCKCIAIFGPTAFDIEKQNFFNQNCAAEAASLRSSLGTSLNDVRGEDARQVDESQIDGTSIQSEDGTEATQAKIEEIDKGALGLSYEKLLIEYLDLRATAQVERFVDDENLADDLNELSEFIAETHFGEVWKDEVGEKSINYSNPRGDSRLLYKWGFRYLGGLLAIIVLVVLVGLGAIFAPFSFAILGSTVLGGGALGLGAGLILAGIIGAFGGKGTPGAYDIQKVKKKKYNLLYKYDGFEKWYVGPKYDNKSNITETRCSVFAKASACLKSAYAFTDTDMKYLTTVPATGHFIVDPKVPPFVDPASISIKGMPVYNRTWVSMINTAVNDGVDYLRTTKPTSSRSKGGYTITKKSFAKRDIMAEALDKKYFIPLRGKFSAKAFNFRQTITDAAYKYATCKELSAGSCALAGVGANAIGFGHLFESEEEAREFARYAYEMHYVYSSVTKEAELGYPLLGTDVYFQSVAYNIKLVTSLAAQRAQNYGQASSLYQRDWEVRANDYQSLGEATLGTTGSSRNITYTPAFFDAFRALDFSGQTQVEGFQGKTTDISGSGFNSSELAALSAAGRQIARVNTDIARAESFDATVGKTQEGELRASNINQVGLGLFSGPSSGAATTNTLATQNSAGSTASLLNSLGGANTESSAKVDGSEKSDAKTSGSGVGTLSNTSSSNNSSSTGFGAGGIDFFGDSGLSDNGLLSNEERLKDQGFSAEAADNLVRALDKEDDLRTEVASDSIFDVVSKAYKRNYSKVLLRTQDLKPKEVAPKDVSDEETEEIKALLDKR